ncbi:unnamed protein product [Ascophyllum nodosum]
MDPSASGGKERKRPRSEAERIEDESAPEDQPMTFMQHDMGLDRRLVKAVAKMGFVYPTLVQSKCIPLALKGKDLLVRARTGSGKTAAFALPLLQKILRRKEAEPGLSRGVRAVVLVPTRELCEQARVHLLELMHYCRDCVSILALVDDNMSAQEAALRDRADILVATPARLVAHLKAGNVELKDTVETLVVDEADLVLSFGYSDDIRTLTKSLPKICQGFLMSATLSPELEDLKRVVLHSPAILKLEEGSRDGRLTQFYLPLREKEDKFLVVFAFLKLGLLEGKGLFFVNDTNSSYRLKLFLEQFHIRSAVLNAELPLNSRLHILQEFNRGIFEYLLVTDDSMDVGRRNPSGNDVGVGQEQDGVSTTGDDAEEEEEGGGGESAPPSSSSEEADSSSASSDEEEDDSDGEKMEQAAGESDVAGGGGGRVKRMDQENPLGKKQRKPSELEQAKATSQGGVGGERRGERYKGKRGGGEAPAGESEFGVARGVDFRGVSFVLNVDFPPTPSSYTHRIGRTARGGSSGTALSLVMVKDQQECRTLVDVQATQPALYTPSLPQAGGGRKKRESLVSAMGAQGAAEKAVAAGGIGVGGSPQPAPLAFDIREIERFRYRVEDTIKKVTRVSVREARAAELKAEIVNSRKLDGYFKENSGDLAVLRHDKSVLHPLRKLEHLKHVPDYLMPSGLTTGGDPTQRKWKRNRRGANRRQDAGRRKDNDPLQTFEASNLGADGASDAAWDDGQEEDPEEGDKKETEEERANRMNQELKNRVKSANAYTGESTSGRRRWQQRRGKGKYGKKTAHAPKKTAKRFDLPV